MPPSSAVQVRSSTKSTAHEASMRPQPHLSFQCGSMEGSLALPRRSAESCSSCLISSGSKDESASSIRATTPEASGVAMLVPSFES